jgi:hypothetical protein
MMWNTTLHPIQAVVTVYTVCYNVNTISAFWAHSYVFCTMLKTDSEYFPTQHQTAGHFEEYAMYMHCIYCQNQILKHCFDECQTLKGSLLNRMVWYEKKASNVHTNWIFKKLQWSVYKKRTSLNRNKID